MRCPVATHRAIGRTVTAPSSLRPSGASLPWQRQRYWHTSPTCWDAPTRNQQPAVARRSPFRRPPGPRSKVVRPHPRGPMFAISSWTITFSNPPRIKVLGTANGIPADDALWAIARPLRPHPSPHWIPAPAKPPRPNGHWVAFIVIKARSGTEFEVIPALTGPLLPSTGALGATGPAGSTGRTPPPPPPPPPEPQHQLEESGPHAEGVRALSRPVIVRLGGNRAEQTIKR
jgi:hypothetical protein